ncbi:MAG: YkgJ family cysteine cluster protein [Synergistaceae bacterium]|nr:YkgJ family cysteine cluster protein [Synergistaceae bacterium]
MIKSNIFIPPSCKIKCKCNRCGLCCRNIGGIKLLEPLDDGTGTCIFLDREKNLCKIYTSRPVFCNVGAMYKLFFADNMSLDEFYEANYAVCRKLSSDIVSVR